MTNKAIYLALGVNMEGHKELLGLWLSENEGAKFWLNVLTELQNRGVKDILIACIDGLKGFPDAIDTAFPETQIQPMNSVVHKVIKKRKLFPTDDSVMKVVYLAVQQASKKWTMPIRNWKPALNRFMIEFEERLAEYV